MPLISHGHANPGQGLTMLHHLPDAGEAAPFARRGDTMSLDAVRPRDVPRGPARCVKEDAQALRTHDIELAAPTYPHKALYTEGPPEKEPVPGASARTHYPDVGNRPVDLSLTTADIFRAQPNAARFRTSRVVNPLTPRYELPSYRELPPEPPGPRVHEGEVRDTLAFKGEWKPRILERNCARNPNEHRDIEHSQPNSRNRAQKLTPRDPLRTVEQAGGRIIAAKGHTARASCPLDPVYDVPARTTHPYLRGELESRLAPAQAGPVEGAAPRALHRANGEPQASLVRSDLPGALPQRYKGTLPFSIHDPPEVTPYSRHLGLDCTDIEGAQPGTRRPGA